MIVTAGSNCVFANSVQLAGHVVIVDHVVFGGMAGGHQFCRFGDRAMVATGAVVVQDVPPFCMVQGDRASITGLNVVGLRRSGLGKGVFSDVKSMFRILYSENKTLDDARAAIASSVNSAAKEDTFLDFLSGSEQNLQIVFGDGAVKC